MNETLVLEHLNVGIDIGSTTVKLAVTHPNTGIALYTLYRRHFAKQTETARALLLEASAVYKNELFHAAVCGSGGRPIANLLNAPYIQEVVAGAASVRKLYPGTRTCVELGGQDAKIIFFGENENGASCVTDMRMNGSCAGGTGAFIDEIAALLGIDTNDFNTLAEKGERVYNISGRCGVFAKTDIQPLLIQGASHADIALSTFHAIAKQTIGGLSQGLSFTPPVIFLGGPLMFNSRLVRVFAERLNLNEQSLVCPKGAQTVIAQGAAIAGGELKTAKREPFTLAQLAEKLMGNAPHIQSADNKPFFISKNEMIEFINRLNKQLKPVKEPEPCGVIKVYAGLDSGSTTSKIALIDENEDVIDLYYTRNNGKSLQAVKEGLLYLRDKHQKRGVTLEITGLGATGYGELMCQKAFGADYHTVETVAHTQSCLKYAPNTDFLLDIGGQDMKAIWLKNGVITNITLNEACSSGCGSFIESFAQTLNIKPDNIAECAFNAAKPAALGSRCTVFMNSTIVTEQKNGKTPNDIMAGLCRAMAENVFTKVIRVPNADTLGKKIAVSGGAFKNAAIVRAIEEYLEKEVTVLPYPAEMGAIGAALWAKRSIERFGYSNGEHTQFIGFDKVAALTHETSENIPCGLCANHCAKTIVKFSTGAEYITGAKCERGAVSALADAKNKPAADMFKIREGLLFKEYPVNAVLPPKPEVIGLPRVLGFWDDMPFWSAFFRALGYPIVFSAESSHKLYESGLNHVASDTVCFPAKVVHGHIKSLAERGANRIFMPFFMHMPSPNANKNEKANHVCPVLKGYPLVIKNFDAPQKRYGVKFDTPVFHFYTENDKKRQLCAYAAKNLGIAKKAVLSAYAQGEAALSAFKKEIADEGEKIIKGLGAGFAVVLAGRPYHTDSFVCHNLPRLFTKQGIPVLTVDSLPGLNNISLKNTRAEITNTFHAQMLAAAAATAREPGLEFAQIVSFGCGHDAILSDEIIRVMSELSDKPPLIVKVDEGDAEGSLRIRAQSFIESVNLRRGGSTPAKKNNAPLKSAYPVKFYKNDKKTRTLLFPNLSSSVAKLFAAVIKKEGYTPKTVPLADAAQIKTGKKYTHNDICFPNQVVIGELIHELNTGAYNQDEVAVGMMKLNCECRLAQYPALLRKALDEAGYTNVPIITNDLTDNKQLHPGFSPFGLSGAMLAARAFIMLDILQSLVRKIRPYELNKGETDRVFEACLDNLAKSVQKNTASLKKAFKHAIDALNGIAYDRSELKPRALVVGEFLIAAHAGSNFHIEEYLEKNGIETIFTRITDTVRKEFLTPLWEKREYGVKGSSLLSIVDGIFDYAQKDAEKIAVRHPLYEKAPRPRDVYENVRHLIPSTLNCGEGWLMSAEIAHYAKQGVESVIILQPFGCLPNHICGRGMTKRLKEEFPFLHFLPLDFDPDASSANIENRLQMQIMNLRFKNN